MDGHTDRQILNYVEVGVLLVRVSDMWLGQREARDIDDDKVDDDNNGQVFEEVMKLIKERRWRKEKKEEHEELEASLP